MSSEPAAKTSGFGEKKTKEEMEESMRKMQRQAKLLTMDKISEEEVKEAESKLAEMQELKGKTAPEIGRKSEMLMTQDHMCNIAIK